MIAYRIMYLGGSRMYVARNRKQAVALFIKDILDGYIPLDDVGFIITCCLAGEQYDYITVPMLHIVGLLSDEMAVYNIRRVLNCSDYVAEMILELKGAEYSWLKRELEKLKSNA